MSEARVTKNILEKVRPTPGQPSVYSNICSVSATPDEVTLQFGVRNAENPEEADGVVTVYISPSHAKRLIRALRVTLGQYEEVFGQVAEDPVLALSPEIKRKIGVPE